MEKHCQVEFEENSLTIKGIEAAPITIDTTGDIEVTSLVESLIQLIESEDRIVLDTLEDVKWDEKKKLIYKLVHSIFEKYNACLIENIDETEPISNVESEQVGVSDYSSYLMQDVNNDDLPF